MNRPPPHPILTIRRLPGHDAGWSGTMTLQQQQVTLPGVTLDLHVQGDSLTQVGDRASQALKHLGIAPETMIVKAPAEARGVRAVLLDEAQLTLGGTRACPA